MRSERRCALVPEEAELIAHGYLLLPPRLSGAQFSRRNNQRTLERRYNREISRMVELKQSEATSQIPNGVAGDPNEPEYHATAPPYKNNGQYDDSHHNLTIDRGKRPGTTDTLPSIDLSNRKFDNKRKHSAFSQSDSRRSSTDPSEHIQHMSEICVDNGPRLLHSRIFGERGSSSVFVEV